MIDKDNSNNDFTDDKNISVKFGWILRCLQMLIVVKITITYK